MKGDRCMGSFQRNMARGVDSIVICKRIKYFRMFPHSELRGKKNKKKKEENDEKAELEKMTRKG